MRQHGEQQPGLHGTGSLLVLKIGLPSSTEYMF